MSWMTAMHMTAAQFRAAYGREPRMAGLHDEESARWLLDAGWGDD